jgi:hypothetical protein
MYAQISGIWHAPSWNYSHCAVFMLRQAVFSFALSWNHSRCVVIYAQVSGIWHCSKLEALQLQDNALADLKSVHLKQLKTLPALKALYLQVSLLRKIFYTYSCTYIIYISNRC